MIKYCALLSIVLLAACSNEKKLVDEMRDIPNAVWAYDQIPDFMFDVTNTQINYEFYLNLKILKTYPYENIYLLTHIKDADGKITTQRANFKLTDENGNPKGGSVSGNTITYQMPIPNEKRFNKAGKYFIAIEQNMRDSVVNGVASIGVMVKEGTPVF
ncbi:MAG: gliding motility lipoprotein GldH [Bacteroidota bacterium]